MKWVAINILNQALLFTADSKISVWRSCGNLLLASSYDICFQCRFWGLVWLVSLKEEGQLFQGYHIHLNTIFALDNCTSGWWQICIIKIYDLKGSFSRGGLGQKTAVVAKCPLKILGSQTISLWWNSNFPAHIWCIWEMMHIKKDRIEQQDEVAHECKAELQGTVGKWW